MLRRRAEWGQGYTLHRRRMERDRWGELRAVYDMEHPDVVVEAGSPNAVCWQDVRTWQVAGELSSGAMREEPGERYRSVLQGALFGDLQVEIYDRFVINGGVYELHKLQVWPEHRLLQLQRME